ncbi:hypothetical protein L228DRAFT_245527 [Xylona heveae TC161]|uniref:Uncharacterized protein n=1 Tax=Xylona heveae (strain CBS 132557 / TC161) TaxID=1328760 RepID=A0A165I928_XYLHT|nr:hypothetical protein L228DRAFT_245527 [Xylona heveae TC161]KZF24564.1 hypothetical protein L228DRAFT_245527 [Xylona heveae TC161]
MWLRVFEAWLTARLLASPGFHRAVRRVYGKVREIRHGEPSQEVDSTRLDRNDNFNGKKFIQYYVEELKEQLRGGPPKR